MVKEKKYSVGRQIFSLLGSHLAICFVTGFLSLVFMGVTDHKAVKIIFSVICIFIYVSWMISASYSAAESDNRSYTPLTPYASKGFVLSVGIAASVAVMWVLYVLVWKFIPMSETIRIPTVIVMLLYIYVTSPFAFLLNITGASANFIGQIVSLVVPIAVCAFGYFAGYKKWDLGKYSRIIMFEKKK